jgi:predicted metalloendopeptidase
MISFEAPCGPVGLVAGRGAMGRRDLFGDAIFTAKVSPDDQRVFLGWAQVWRGKTRDDALIQRLHTDPHSPETARVNAVVRNVDAGTTPSG